MASCSLNLVWSLISFSCTMWSACYAANRDTLKPGDTLNSSDTLVSAMGKFTLSFTALDKGKPNYSYLVLQPSEDIIPFYSWIWIANRNTPIMYPTGALTLDRNGTLKITQKGRDPIELFSAPRTTNINSTTSVVVATLLDTGNFILKELSSIDGSTKQVLWQSFDYLADTFLPGMKLGVNYRNGHIWLLTSSLIDSSPETGAFTFEWDPKGHQLQIKQYGVLYWSSGAFRDGTFEFLSPYYGEQRVCIFSVVSNENEDYFTYTNTVNNSGDEWLRLDSEGKLRRTLTDILEKYSVSQYIYSGLCDGNNTEGGCQKRHQPTCRYLGDRFEKKVGFFSPIIESSEPTIDSNTSLGISDCQAACWENCDCVGFYFNFDNETGCRFWTGKSEFNEDTTGNTTTNYFVLTKSSRKKETPKSSPPLINEKEKIKSSRRNARKWILIGTAIAAALLVMVLCISSYLLRRKLFSGEANPMIENELVEWMESDRSTGNVKGLQNDGKLGNNLTVFSYASVMAATTNFSEENKLGQGGFGPVYKGKLLTGQEIAVKRLSRCSGQGTSEFKNELILISELQHTNLVQLFGFCIHGEERILIYAYMPNKSLDYFLFDSTRAMLLDWTKRFNIIEGIAQGLLYLHKYSRMRAWELWKEGRGLELMDPTLKDSCIEDQLLRCFHVGLLCVEENADDRPSMSDVVSMLTTETISLPLPTMPAFITRRNVIVSDISRRELQIISVNGLSNTTVAGR
ncbi:G-type lectin S-receptor-like serine/threonine-protein kinase CES101 isoform X2 [Prunus avium]|uniref:Receptor-like serine/threonine-protein kinase n=1 Tax=Prunus avium TaxID=42229 RepID=A0A6P5TNL1_PRUAV|nr:G-type lectin S-receptor-like serine/threonine-protein kinase CES101 isoform X2 [Prunus avium]